MKSTSKALTFLVFTLFALLFISCQRREPQSSSLQTGQLKEPLINANREALREEDQQIDDFIRRYNWNMEKTSTGLRVMVTKNGIGPAAQPGRTVKLSYTVTLLTGDTMYTALNDGPLIFEVGKGQVVTGLEEAILLLRVGDRAKIIIPSHLAFGLIGDQKKINHKASLVYDLEFISMF